MRSDFANELTPERLLRRTVHGDNEVYVVDWHTAPNVVREVGRLRELAFSRAGGGTGQEIDLDELDLCEKPYKQLIVWDPRSERILGGYRYMLGWETPLDEEGQPVLATSHLFRFSSRFIEESLSQTIELGRSFVTPDLGDGRSIFALDNLWDGLGALTVVEPRVRWFFGKFTMYPTYPTAARDLIQAYLKAKFGDEEGLVTPMKPIVFGTPSSVPANYKELKAAVRMHGVNIPPLVNAYMGLSPTMKWFGAAVNEPFGMVEETGILINVDEILPAKKARHIDSFTPWPATCR